MQIDTISMSSKKKLSIPFIVVVILLIVYLHYSTGYGHPSHEIYAELHYVPVLVAALVFGLRGALLVSAIIFIVYAPYVVKVSTGTWISLAAHSVHILFPALFGLLVGFLIDLERKRRLELEKGRYLAGLGQAGAALVHDLRNPLMVIQGYAERMQDGQGDPLTSAKKITDAAASIGQIVNSVLNFAAPITLERKEENVGDFINELCEKERPRAEGHGVSLVASTEPNADALIDRRFFERAMLNLITNAIEASHPGEKVMISTSKTRNGVIIRILDHGKGMDRTTLENLFVPFYSKKTKGTGLGMAIAKKVIVDHGGRIEVTSQLGVGTDISVILPLAAAVRG